MIRRVSLRNWRAYQQLDLTLTRPVTFLVAANGVGKSSLVEAVRWAVLGTPVDRDRGRAVRNGRDAASVTVELELAAPRPSRAAGSTPVGSEIDGPRASRIVELTRTLRPDGAATFRGSVDGRELSEGDYLATLAQAWTADVGLLDSIVFGPVISTRTSAFPIRDHLASVFGIEPLLRAATAVKGRRDAIASRIRTMRDDMSGTDDAIAAARSLIDKLQQAVTAAETERDDSAEEATRLEGAARWSRAWQQYRDQVGSYREQTKTLVAAMSLELEAPDAGWSEDPRVSLETARAQATSEFEVARAASAEADLEAARSASATQLLAGATDVCPTCLRPLSEDERGHALAIHNRHGSEAHAATATLEEQTESARAILTTIARYNDSLSQLRVPVEPDHDDPGQDGVTAADEARTAAQVLDQTVGALHERLTTAQRQLDDLQAAAADRVELNRLAARDLALEMAQRSLSAVTDRLLIERVEPLATEIAHRWKLLFGTEGLQLTPDGQLSVSRAGVDLRLTDLSGGERATALLISRIILIAAATHASTLWLDEPLEHLDPGRRASVAQTLVRAAQTGTVDQILVTTYEEGLARRLQATAPEIVQLTYARTTSDFEVH